MLIVDYIILYTPFLLLIYLASLAKAKYKKGIFTFALYCGVMTLIIEFLRFSIPYFFFETFFKAEDSSFNFIMNMNLVRDVLFALGFLLLTLGFRKEMKK